jgi:hypothetical protein
MIKRLASAAALSLLLTGAAFAQSEPKSETPAATPAAPAAPAPSAAPAAPAAPAPAATEAAATPSTLEACIDAAAALGQAAERKSFADDKAEKLDQLFSKMETLCDGKKFDEAMAVAKDIKSVIDGN